MSVERKEVFTIVERNKDAEKFWCRIGSAFVNKDGSLNVFLDALPVNGTLHIRDPKPRDDDRGGGTGTRNRQGGGF